MPVYNTPVDYIRDSINSLFCQSIRPDEIVIVNDGSSDETTEFLQSLKERWSIIKLVSTGSNVGVARALNIGLCSCDCDLILRFDADDIAAPPLIEEQVMFMENNPLCKIRGVQMQCFGHMNYSTMFPAKIDRLTAKESCRNFHLVNHAGLCFRREWFINEIGCYVETPKGCPEDYPTWVNVLLKGFEIYQSNKVLLKYRTYDRPQYYENKEYFKYLSDYEKKL